MWDAPEAVEGGPSSSSVHPRANRGLGWLSLGLPMTQGIVYFGMNSPSSLWLLLARAATREAPRTLVGGKPLSPAGVLPLPSWLPPLQPRQQPHQKQRAAGLSRTDGASNYSRPGQRAGARSFNICVYCQVLSAIFQSSWPSWMVNKRPLCVGP